MIRSIVAFLLVALLNTGYAQQIQGRQPNISIDTKGVVRMAYGDGENIYCVSSKNNGLTFSQPVLVAKLPGMHLGHTRGPQIASSKSLSIITAIDKKGSIHSFVLNHLKNQWKESGAVNDQPGSAVEGLMALAADKEDNFYATWLDIRIDQLNNIFFSAFRPNASGWTKNQLVYRSPDKHVCECCKPNIAVSGNRIAVGFRNWLAGSRDIYYSVSGDKGKTFAQPKKTGSGTWPLKACPMDGGGLAISAGGVVSSAWRRNTDVYYWAGKGMEQKIGTGKDVGMVQTKSGSLVTWQENNNIKVMNLNKKPATVVGKGVSPKIYSLPNGKALCVWEDDKTIGFKVI